MGDFLSASVLLIIACADETMFVIAEYYFVNAVYEVSADVISEKLFW